MEPELKKKWIEALRSGEYEQGKFRFEYDGKFCCLGVLCKVAGEPTKKDDQKDGNWDYVYSIITGQAIVDRLWQMNDGALDTPQKSFPEIADYIEENL